MVTKQFKLNILRLRLGKILLKQRETIMVYRLRPPKISVGMHSDVSEWIYFKLGIMIDTIVLYILNLV